MASLYVPPHLRNKAAAEPAPVAVREAMLLSCALF